MKTIGIDPGTNTGFAVVQDGRIVRLETSTFFKVFDLVRDELADGDVSAIYTEYPRTKKNWHLKPGMPIGQIITIATNTGMAHREMTLMASGLELYFPDAKVYRVYPFSYPSAEEFSFLTGWPGRTNEHVRAAAMLALTPWNPQGTKN